MFDLNALAIIESATLHLLHPASGDKLYADKEQKKPITINVASTSSREYRTAVNAMHNRTLKRGNKKLTAEQQKEEGVELLVAVCISADNLVLDGAAIKSESDFRALLLNDKFSWIKGQIDEFLGNLDVFIL